MIALKDDDVWDQLGSSDFFPDGLDNPYPPFAFNSGMDVRDVIRSEPSSSVSSIATPRCSRTIADSTTICRPRRTCATAL